MVCINAKAKILSKKELEENFKELLKKNKLNGNEFFSSPSSTEVRLFYNNHGYITITDTEIIGKSQCIDAKYFEQNKDFFTYFTNSSDYPITPALSFDSIKEDDNYRIINEDEESILVEYGTYPQRKIVSSNEFDDLLMKFHSGILVENGEITFKIYSDGKIDKMKKYKDTKNGKEYAFVTEKECELYYSIEDMKADDLQRTNCTCGEILPIKWLVNKKTNYMIPLSGLMVSENYGDYRKSKLKEYLESDNFFVDIGVTAYEKKKEKSSNIPWKIIDKKKNLVDTVKKVLMGYHRIPYLVGHPGIGKTAIAKSINKNYLAYNVSTFTPDRFTGKTMLIPGKTRTFQLENDYGAHVTEQIEPGYTSIAEPDWYKDLCAMAKKCAEKGERCLLLFDEFDKLTPNMQVFINGVVDSPRNIANLVIPDNVDIIFAGNTEQYSDTSFNISGEVESRLTRIEVEKDFQSWMAWAIKNDVDPLVRAYLHANPSDLLKDELNEKGQYDYSKSLTPRSWDQKISEEIKVSRKLNEYPNLDLYMESNTIKKFEEYMEVYYNLRIEDIINGIYSEVNTFTLDYSELSEYAKTLAVVISNQEQLENSLSFLKKFNNAEILGFFKNQWITFNESQEDITMLRDAESNILSESEVTVRYAQ